jgi:signal transduction histidine kinase
LIWSSHEEPWVFFSTLRTDSFSEQRLGPGALGSIIHSELEGEAFIFDIGKRRAICSSDVRALRPKSGLDAIDATVGGSLGCNQGLCVRISADEFSGLMILCDIEGLCLDDLALGRELARDLRIVLNRVSSIGLSAAAASNRTRLSLARDVHDSVLQLLAAAGFRLEALRRATCDPGVQMA